jgi:hypothetical protein
MGILVYNGQSIEQRDTDGMVNITDMAKAIENPSAHTWKTVAKNEHKFIVPIELWQLLQRSDMGESFFLVQVYTGEYHRHGH